MNKDLDSIKILEQEKKSLEEKNAELEKQLSIIKVDFEKFKAVIDNANIINIADEVKKKVLISFGVVGGISIVGLVLACFSLLEFTKTAIKEKVLSAENFPQIQKTIENGLQEEKYLVAISNSVSKDISLKIWEKVQKEKEFNDTIVNAVAERLTNDKEFVGIFKAQAKSAVDIAVYKVAEKNPNSEIGIAINQSIKNKQYYVVAASSEDKDDLKTANILDKVRTGGKDAYVCEPIGTNRRSVLLVTTSKSKKELSLELATKVQNEIKKTAEFDGLYILATDSMDNIYFNVSSCKLSNL